MKKKRFHNHIQWLESYSLFFSTQLFSPSLSFCSLMVLFTERVNIQMSNLAYNWVQLQDRSRFGFRTEEHNTDEGFQLFTFSLTRFVSLLHRFLLQAQHERADNCALKEENHRIRCENIAIREALKHTICPTSCGDAPSHEDSYFDEQKLRIENAHLKEEVLAKMHTFFCHALSIVV